MREVVRVVAMRVSIAYVTGVIVSFSSGAQAQLRPESTGDLAPVQAEQQTQPTAAAGRWPALKQIPLTAKQIEGVIEAQLEFMKSDSWDFDEVVKQHGFSGPDEYTNIFHNIDLVLYGFDPYSKKYLGPEAAIKAQIAHVKASETMSGEPKKRELDSLNAELKSPPPPLEHTGNIDLVAKYYDQLYVLGEWP